MPGYNLPDGCTYVPEFEDPDVFNAALEDYELMEAASWENSLAIDRYEMEKVYDLLAWRTQVVLTV